MSENNLSDPACGVCGAPLPERRLRSLLFRIMEATSYGQESMPFDLRQEVCEEL